MANYTKAEKEQAFEELMRYEVSEITVYLESVSSASERFRIVADNYGITKEIATLLDLPYDTDKGLKVNGYGKDLAQSTLIDVNKVLGIKDWLPTNYNFVDNTN